jgi:NADP-dependent 3-hydroxy acid dehydrogenase YdfG/acyl carrier protein
VIPLEHPAIACRLIDVGIPSSDDWQTKTVLSNLFSELESPTDQRVVALRGHQRLVQTYEPIPLPAIPEGPPPVLRDCGVYLITGGLGGIGLAMAEYIARKVRSKLVLLNRSQLPPREQWSVILEQANDKTLQHRIRAIQSLEELGSEVLVLQADVSREDEVVQAVQQTIARFGTINGVLHAAGVPGVGLIQHKTTETVAAVLAPKILGTLNLETAVRGLEPDFLVLFSSIASVTGALGQLDYAAANAFLGAYAVSCLRKKRLTVAIDWNEWQWNSWESGLGGFQKEVQTFFQENRKRFGIQFDEGGDALHRILTCGLPHVVVSPQDFPKFLELAQRFTIDTVRNWGSAHGNNSRKYPRPLLGVSFVTPGNDLEHSIAAIWGNTLGLEEVGINDNFFELGGNSLIGVALVANLRKTLGVETIPMHILYEAPTISSLAQFINQDHATDSEVITEQLARGEQRRQRLKSRRLEARMR